MIRVTFEDSSQERTYDDSTCLEKYSDIENEIDDSISELEKLGYNGSILKEKCDALKDKIKNYSPCLSFFSDLFSDIDKRANKALLKCKESDEPSNAFTSLSDGHNGLREKKEEAPDKICNHEVEIVDARKSNQNTHKCNDKPKEREPSGNPNLQDPKRKDVYEPNICNEKYILGSSKKATLVNESPGVLPSESKHGVCIVQDCSGKNYPTNNIFDSDCSTPQGNETYPFVCSSQYRSVHNSNCTTIQDQYDIDISSDPCKSNLCKNGPCEHSNIKSADNEREDITIIKLCDRGTKEAAYVFVEGYNSGSNSPTDDSQTLFPKDSTYETDYQGKNFPGDSQQTLNQGKLEKKTNTEQIRNDQELSSVISPGLHDAKKNQVKPVLQSHKSNNSLLIDESTGNITDNGKEHLDDKKDGRVSHSEGDTKFNTIADSVQNEETDSEEGRIIKEVSGLDTTNTEHEGHPIKIYIIIIALILAAMLLFALLKKVKLIFYIYYEIDILIMHCN
ncbi:hypothetical protein PGO_000805 [Plasmodium gonderi]|uniref:Variable surface protein n=1 Tax=Plasmodium gonderi TaxID=77519 RepID=A0A1Y1JP82_PLAGO|nr:hypothetical protein PGO_000805 [Plasmodium gonderi]GAW84050.1 hypothetical protein PGO_000805 [Plasmodium gonderi]